MERLRVATWLGTERLRIALLGVVVGLGLGGVEGGVGIGVSAAYGGETEDIRALAAMIDKEVDGKLARNQVVPARIADDPTFLRRVRLDLTGVIPSSMEVQEFSADPSLDKRAKLTDRLLANPAYIAQFGRMWTATYIPEASGNGQFERILSPQFEAWMRSKLAANAGYDAIVKEIIAAPLNNPRVGYAAQADTDPTPVAFIMAKQSKPENLGAAAARMFLGIRLECAQCHDHPFEEWKREQFWEFAAFFAGVSGPVGDAAFFSPPNETKNRFDLKIPDTKTTVKAKFIDGKEPKFEKDASSRQVLADWLTSKENPWFAKAAVNRVWAHLMGVGIVDPPDDFSDSNPPSHPELLDAMARDFAAHDFKIPYLIKAIVASKTYQRSSIAASGSSTAEPQLFAKMAVKALSAQELHDSIGRASGFRDADENANVFFFGALNDRQAFLSRFERKGESAAKAETSILQALTLINGKIVDNATNTATSPILGSLADASFWSPDRKVEALYLAALGRKPYPEEREKIVAFLGSRPLDKGLEDLFWALLNSPEFAANH